MEMYLNVPRFYGALHQIFHLVYKINYFTKINVRDLSESENELALRIFSLESSGLRERGSPTTWKIHAKRRRFERWSFVAGSGSEGPSSKAYCRSNEGPPKSADPPKFEAKSAIGAKILDKSAICCINKIRNPCKTFDRSEIRTIFSVKSDDPKSGENLFTPPPPPKRRRFACFFR
jgi:hypothetical protein